MFSTMMVTFREGIEAFLIIAITSLYLRNTGRLALLGAVRWGTGVALAGSIALGIILARIGAMTPLWEGALALIAMVLVLTCTVHMLRHGKLMAQQIRERIDAADHAGSAAFTGVFLFSLLMIGREGVETATMLAALSSQGDMREFLAGGLLGVALAGLLAITWLRYGKRINLSRFFQVTAVFMALFSAQLLIYAFHELSEAGALPGLDNAWWHLATEPYGPEGEYGAWLSYALVVVPLAFLAWSRWRDQQAPA
jgi:high-affinity iron transporter